MNWLDFLSSIWNDIRFYRGTRVITEAAQNDPEFRAFLSLYQGSAGAAFSIFYKRNP